MYSKTLFFLLAVPFILNAQPNKLFTNIEEALKSPQDVFQLELINMNLETVPKEVFLFPNLKELILAGNNLSALPEEISKLSNLEFLDLYSNRFIKFPDVICRLPSLQKLNIGFNYLKKLPPCISELKLVHSLHLGVNYLGESTELFLPPYLDSLNLSGNRFQVIPNAVLNQKKLQILVFSANYLKELPKELAQLEELKQLYINQMELHRLPDELGNLSKLDVLDLSCIGISPSYRKLPANWKNLRNLRYLNLYGAKLSQWPKWLCSLHSLKVVNTSEPKKVPNCLKSIVIENADFKLDALLRLLNNK